MNKITVVPYNPEWKEEFGRASQFFNELLQSLDVRVEHVGSTAVEGLWAKPILDIDLIVPNTTVSALVIKKLQSVGYVHVGNYGVEGREALKYEENNERITWMTHHLYVCIEGTENVVNHIMLRNHLRKSEAARVAYGKLKQTLAEKHPNDIDAYVEGKTELITSLLAKEGMNPVALERITMLNRKVK